MATEKPVFKHNFDLGEAIATPWNLPGGKNFLARIVGWGTGLILIVYALFGRKFISAYADFIIQSAELQNAADPNDPEAVMELVSGMWAFMGSMLLLGLFAWLVMISIETAMHKNVFRGTDHGAFPLRFGKDEFRVLLAQLVIFICVSAIYFIGIMAIIILSAVMVATGSGALAVIGGLLSFVGFIVFLVVLIRVFIGWAPAAALSVRDEKQRVFEGWAIAKGRNWPLFGTYLVTVITGYIAIYVIMIIGGFIAFGNIEFLTLMTSTSDDPAAVMAQMGEAISQPRVMVPLVIFTIFYMLATVLWYVHLWGIATYMAKLDARENNLNP